MSGSLTAAGGEQVRILATIAFTFRKDRLKAFLEVLTGFASYGDGVVDVVVTTTATSHEIERVERLALPLLSGGLNLSFIRSPHDPSNPFRITWAHKRLITERFLPDPGYSHFIYVEDDIHLSRRNFDYFLIYREALRPHGLLPGFLRYEHNRIDQRLYLVDHRAPTRTQGVPAVEIGRLSFLNPDPPYQACYILDRDLAREHVATPSFDREASDIYGIYGEPERANMALSFDNVPRNAGFTNRYAVPLDRATGLPYFSSLLRHLSDNFTNADSSSLGFGSLPVEWMFEPLFG